MGGSGIGNMYSFDGIYSRFTSQVEVLEVLK